MTTRIFDEWAQYATPPNNYIGTTIFLSYIVLALYATTSISYSLFTQYTNIFRAHPKDKDELRNTSRFARARHIKIYAFLASISFATLSYHMLFFLITHYEHWSDEALSAVSGEKAKRWMLESTLFQDFATELVENKRNAVWTQIAILATWLWNIWMGRKARTHIFSASSMGHFLLLSQILPICFTACLFIIQLHLSSPDMQLSETKGQITTPATARRKIIASLHLPNILLNASLLALPSLRSHSIFMSLVLLERIILALPHTGLVSLRASDVDKSTIVSAGFIVASQVMARQSSGHFGAEAQALWKSGYAVKALGWDAVLGMGVWGCLAWGGGV
ncbi:hypothetical protein BDU57DRAFT_505931 [Ampelomyces quisqualis]|uniref:Uncharacterized protein n=1 Tax=Ampelomyces quisqualis TaxID=50730 RepID=A0A6A5Q9E4_AMPQU|nr:hypothetical protein BDU57DRAFT_505931 [Ampelomyces quisqualis]